jgi:hypothetical protein
LLSLVSYLLPAPTITITVADSIDGMGIVKTRSPFLRIVRLNFIIVFKHLTHYL